MKIQCQSCGSPDVDKDGVCQHCGVRNVFTLPQTEHLVGELEGAAMVQFRQAISTRLNYDQFKELCQLVGVDHEDLPGQGKSAKVMELIMHCKRRDKLTQLRIACQHYYDIAS